MTDQEKEEAIKEFVKSVNTFPSLKERKITIFNSLNEILKALGSYLNDPQTELKIITKNDKEYFYYKNVYGEFTQDITHDSASAFFEDVLKLLLLRCKELEGVKSTIDYYFQEYKKEA